MSGIRRENTKPEIMFRKGLYKRGYRYRLHAKPDLVLAKYNVIVFIHGILLR
ncbi:MAG: very short patch repair endonuclease [Gammaproteobacteria bacterium]|nr:very short patch repair endonuclease [Gammaproteobacteria bacterium]